MAAAARDEMWKRRKGPFCSKFPTQKGRERRGGGKRKLFHPSSFFPAWLSCYPPQATPSRLLGRSSPLSALFPCSSSSTAECTGWRAPCMFLRSFPPPSFSSFFRAGCELTLRPFDTGEQEEVQKRKEKEGKGGRGGGDTEKAVAAAAVSPYHYHHHHTEERRRKSNSGWRRRRERKVVRPSTPRKKGD